MQIRTIKWTIKEALSITKTTVEAFVSALQITAPEETPSLFNVRVAKKGLTAPAGQIKEVRSRVRGWHHVISAQSRQ